VTAKRKKSASHVTIAITKEDHAALLELQSEIVSRGTKALGSMADELKNRSGILGLGAVAGFGARVVLRELQAGPSKWRTT
jgi:hypothetical protein